MRGPRLTRTAAPRAAFRFSPADFAWFSMALLIGTACAFILAGCEPAGLDRAQSRFEHRDHWPTPADFDGWRSTGSLKCKDFPSLRICEAIFPFFDDGKPVGEDRVAFACSPDDCQWVDP